MRTFAMGEKARLADLTAATALRVEVAGTAPGADVAAFCFALDASGRIPVGRGPVSTARPASLESAVALVSGGGADAAFDLDLDAVADDVHRLLFVIASVGLEIGLDGASVAISAEGAGIAAFAMPPGTLKGQRALILGEVYRRDGWRFGAVGQGYRDGLDQLVRDHGGDPSDVAPEEAVDAVEGADAAQTGPEPEPELAAPVTAEPAPESPPEPEAAVASEAEPAEPAEPVKAAEPGPASAEPGVPVEPAAEPETAGPVASVEPEPEPEPEQIAPAASVEGEPEPEPKPEPASAAEPEASAPSAEPASGEPPSVTAVPCRMPVPTAVTYEGSGDRVLRIARPVPEGPVVAEITGTGAGNFAVWTLDAALEQDKLLVNEIGACHGRVLLDERGTHTERLKIESDGPWTVVIHPPTAAPWLTGPVTGDGPEVLRWTGPRTVVAMTHAGSSNFMVRAYAETPTPGEDPYLASLANAIGPYEGESIVPVGPCLLEIEADGDWTLTPEG